MTALMPNESSQAVERLSMKSFMLKENKRFQLTQVVERSGEPKMSDYEKFVVDVSKRLGQSLEYLHQLGIVVRDFDYESVVMT